MAEFWRVNSYGYPNPFSTDSNAQQAWATLTSFYDFTSYRQLKRYWASNEAPRLIKSQTVESWKATFEEFGLLYVISGSDEINVTPAGRQFLRAVENEDLDAFSWIGLSLLLRYPLRGPRHPRSPQYGESDLLLYWFLYASLLDLQNDLWWTEVERVLCTVLRVEEALGAVNLVRALRAGDVDADSLPLPAAQRRGVFYNSLNQVFVHAGMSQLILGKSRDDSYYEEEGRERRHWVNKEFVPVVELALGGRRSSLDCDGSTSFVERMPHAPDFAGDEEAYFNYLGAEVQAMPDTSAEAIRHVTLHGESVAVLRSAVDYEALASDVIAGRIDHLCTLARGQRVILSHDLKWSYIVQSKKRATAGNIHVALQRGKPIINKDPIISILGGNDV